MSEEADSNTGKKPGGRCPMCGRASDAQLRPFCSKRCANIDLSRWLSGGYVIPGSTADTDGEDYEVPTVRDDDDDGERR